MTNHEDKLVEQAKAALEKQADELDDNVVARLRAARLRASEVANQKNERPGWVMWIGGSMANILTRPAGALVTATLVLGVVTSLWVANPSAPRHGIEDLELLASVESPEFYQDLEFYLWLEDETRVG